MNKFGEAIHYRSLQSSKAADDIAQMIDNKVRE